VNEERIEDYYFHDTDYRPLGGGEGALEGWGVFERDKICDHDSISQTSRQDVIQSE
jgi:hypothetical protein